MSMRVGAQQLPHGSPRVGVIRANINPNVSWALAIGAGAIYNSHRQYNGLPLF
jgi:hypothetical protein